MLKRFLLVLVPVMAFQATADSASFGFGAPVDRRVVGGAEAVAVADFNGDGRDDLVALMHDHLEVSLQYADGSPGSSLRLEFPSSYVHVIQGADLGADGTMEILVGHGAGLAIYKWDGSGGFDFANHSSSSCWNIATADIDSDGATDVLCIGDDAEAMLFYSDPASVLATPTYMQTAAMDAGQAGQAQLKDVTGDGKPDLLLASGFANSFFVYPHDGDRAFLPAVAYPYPEETYLWSHTIEAVDLEHDGVNEVVVTAPCNMPCAALYFYRQGAQGYLELSERRPTLDNPGALIATDLDGDGHQDLLVEHRSWFTVGRYMGQGLRLSTAELWSSVFVQLGPRALGVGDLNHDGYTDVAVANSFGISVLYGGRQAPSDFNNDFASDLVWRSGTGESVLWESANSALPQSLPANDPSWSGQAIGDFDGDGSADLFWRNRATGANEIWSAGTSLISPTAGVASQDWQVVGAGDFDGDHRSDLLWRNTRTGANTVWKSGNSTTLQATTGEPDQRWKVAGLGDFDGDGRSDILWRHSSSGSNAIWRSGRRDRPQAVAAVRSLQWKVAGIGDFNGDNKDDISWRNTSTGANAIWLSANSATPMPVTRVSDLAWVIAAVADYNGDGRADLMWRNGSTGANVIWRSADSRQAQAVTAISGWSVVR